MNSSKYKEYKQEGYLAYFKDKGVYKNPYRRDFKELKKAFYWNVGFCNAEKRMLEERNRKGDN